MYLLAIYEIDQAFGGPEEGGWYFNTGQLVRVIAATRNEDEAYAKARRCNALLEKLQKDKRPVSSVIYTGGRHAVHVYKDVVPKHFPEVRPHYE